MLKRVLGIIAILIIFVVGWFAVNRMRAQQQAAIQNSLETQTLQLENLQVAVEADGVVESNQTALLYWKTSGTVADVAVSPGDPVPAGKQLASLESTSLPQSIILAQTQLISAQRYLDNLLQSNIQRAQAQKAVETAQQALEDAQSKSAQASALQAAAAAQKAVDNAQLNLDILVTPASQGAVDQAYANLLLAKNVLNQTQDSINRVEKRLAKPTSQYFFFESRSLYRKILENLEIKRARDQRSYEDALENYNRLIEQADPLDVQIAEGNLLKAKAELLKAQQDYERIKNGPLPGDLAVLQARLADAQREFDRLKDGPDPDEIAAAQARVSAAQATLEMMQIQAPFPGTITQALNKPGDLVSAGELAFRLDDLSHMLITVQISEIDINRMQPGMKAVIKFDSVPGKEYTGEIIEVPTVGATVNDLNVFNVKVEIMDADVSIKTGTTASVNIVVQELANILTIPNAAIRFINGQQVVYLRQGDQLTPVNVTLGEASSTSSQVLEGNLKPGDQVVLNPPESIVAQAIQAETP